MSSVRLLIIDNYDSFTWNLVQRFGELDSSITMRVERNDAIDVDAARAWNPTHLVLSPGPCTPRESGVCLDMIPAFRGAIPMLGVCLGHQAMADVSSIPVVRHHRLMHGKTSPVHHDGKGVFAGLPNPMTATRYHSLIVRRSDVTPDFTVTAWANESGEDEVMGLRWNGPAGAAPMEGVQFHPESFLTTHGPWLLANFLGLPHPRLIDVPAESD